jgi:hypothetical protein
MSEQVSQVYEVMGKIITLHILIYQEEVRTCSAE